MVEQRLKTDPIVVTHKVTVEEGVQEKAFEDLPNVFHTLYSTRKNKRVMSSSCDDEPTKKQKI